MLHSYLIIVEYTTDTSTLAPIYLSKKRIENKSRRAKEEKIRDLVRVVSGLRRA